MDRHTDFGIFGDYITYRHVFYSRDSVVGIATGYGMDDRGVGVRVPMGAEFPLLHVVQTSSGVHATSYPKGFWGSFSGDKAAGT
jgi:hypothetical protein